MSREQVIAEIRQIDGRIRQADERREELNRQFEEMPLEEWADAVVAECTRELTAKEQELMDQMECHQKQADQNKSELYALLDEKDVLVRELCKCLSDPEEQNQVRSAWERERIERRKNIDPNDVIDISDVRIGEDTSSLGIRIVEESGFSEPQINKPGEKMAAGEYSPEESEALSGFARTGNPKSLVSLAVKEQSGNGRSNPLGAMVLNRLTAEVDGERRGLLGRAYLKRNTLMKKSCEQKGEEFLFGAAAHLDWSEFSEQGREDYENGNYGRAARCLSLSVEKLLKKGMDVLDSRAAKQWLVEECRLLADMYLEGKGTVAATPEWAVFYLETAVEQAQDTEAAYRLGVLYSEGKRISASPGQARKYMTMAANQGHVRAGTDLAYAMLTSQEWAKDLYSESRVLSCLNAGLKSGDERAAFYMGLLCCIQGRLDDAVTWFEKLPNWDAAGMTLGQIYYKQGNYQKAVPYLKKACDVQGNKYGWEYTINSHAQESHKFMRLSECMGHCYASSLGGCEKDYQKAKLYLEDAAAYQGVQAQTYDKLSWLYIMDGDSDVGKAEKILRYWLKGQDLGSSQVPINLGGKMAVLIKNSGTDGGKKSLVSRCAERLKQLAKEGNLTAKYEYCAYLVNFSPVWIMGTDNQWEYSDRNFFPGNEKFSHYIAAPNMEQYLDEAFTGGIRFAAYVKGKHYLKINKTAKAHEAFQKGAAAGDSRAKGELSYFKKTLLGYSYQK